MKKRTLIPDILIIITACTAVFFLCGLPSNLHLTPARIILVTAVFSECIGWFFFSRNTVCITNNTGLSALIFQSSLVILIVSVLLIPAGAQLMLKEGTLYSIGAFLHQSEPFLIFLAVLCSVTCIWLFFSPGVSPKKILTENHSVLDTVLIFAACILIYGAYLPLRDNYYPSHDYSIFAYFGQQILRGKMPYTELWDHKPPVIFYFNALGLKIAEGSLAGIWMLDFLLFFLGSVIFFNILKKHYSFPAALPVFLAGTLHYVRVFDFGNYTEELSLFFVLTALSLYFTKASHRHSGIMGYLSGLLCGIAFTCKQNTIGCWCALFLTGLIRLLPINGNKDEFQWFVKYWLFTIAGFLSVNLIWVSYFAHNHALAAYWDVAFRFNFIYSEKSADSRLACAITTLTFLPSVTPFLFIAFLSWLPACIRFFREGPGCFVRTHTLAAWALIDLPAELILAGLSGMNYQHYFILCIPPAVILLCSLTDYLFTHPFREKLAYRAVTVLLLIICTIPLIPLFKDNYMHRMPSSYTKTSDYLISSTDPDKPVLVWGSRSAVYVMSNRYAPTAYFNERPLYLFPAEIQERQWNELLTDLENDPPQVVIYTHDTALPFIAKDAAGCVIPGGTEYTDKVFGFFCNNYAYETTINPEFQDSWDIFRYTSEN